MTDNMQPHRQPFEIALELRNFEIELFWKRSNYFLVLNTGVIIALLTQSNTKIPLFLISIIGIVFSYLWLRINLGSKFWQEKWEMEVSRTDPTRDLLFFNKSNFDIKKNLRQKFDSDITEEIKHGKKKRIKNILRTWILSKPSVSETMTYLSVFFIALWSCAFIYSIYQYCTCRI